MKKKEHVEEDGESDVPVSWCQEVDMALGVVPLLGWNAGIRSLTAFAHAQACALENAVRGNLNHDTMNSTLLFLHRRCSSTEYSV